MANRRTTSRTRATGFRPATSWSAFTPTGGVTVPFGTKVLLGSFVGDFPSTIRRTRAMISWRSDQRAADEFPFGAFGMCIVSNDAFAAGAASLPGPYTDAASDLWFVHTFLVSNMLAGSNEGFQELGKQVQYEIDSKAMRKLTDEESVAVMIENAHISAGASALIMIRLLSSISGRS